MPFAVPSTSPGTRRHSCFSLFLILNPIRRTTRLVSVPLHQKHSLSPCILSRRFRPLLVVAVLLVCVAAPVLFWLGDVGVGVRAQPLHQLHLPSRIVQLAEQVGMQQLVIVGRYIFVVEDELDVGLSGNLVIVPDFVGIGLRVSNASKFSAAFKKRFGLTPTEWKSKNVL